MGGGSHARGRALPGQAPRPREGEPPPAPPRTGRPRRPRDLPGARLVEIRLGDESSFDAWVNGEWVREVLFRNLDDALRRVPGLVREYLTTSRAASLA